MAKKRLNQTQFALLGLLETEPGTGYDLKRRIGESIAHFWQEGWGQIYPTLKQLEVENLVRRSVMKSGKRELQVYRITRLGRAHLTAWLASPVSPEVPRNELLLKLFFGGQLDRIQEHVAVYRKEQERLLSNYISLESQLRRKAAAHPQLPFWLITLNYGRHRVQALIRWCEETQKTLDTLEWNREGTHGIASAR
ncbi:MAG TPA: PadR family transcriptional regulator [Acidobacteriaceae bacterium]